MLRAGRLAYALLGFAFTSALAGGGEPCSPWLDVGRTVFEPQHRHSDAPYRLPILGLRSYFPLHPGENLHAPNRYPHIQPRYRIIPGDNYIRAGGYPANVCPQP